jgi:hypothetical protein
MAASNSKSDQSEARENLRNLALIVGITLLLILAVILTAFFISEVVNNGPAQQQVTNTPTPSNPPAPAPNPEPAPVATTPDSGDSSNSTNNSTEGSTSSAETTSPVVTPEAPVVAPASGSTAGESTATNNNSATAISYSFTAGNGDSVSWLARRAMYAYLGERGLGLDAGQRLYFEITLTNMSAPSGLDVGDVRTFTASLMDQIFTNAVNLPVAEHMSWNITASNVGYI